MAEPRGTLDDQPVFGHEEPSDGAPVLYLHGNPTCADDWLPFLARTGGIAPDLPGFGRSGKRADLAYDMAFYDAWIERFLDWRGIDRVRLLVHDWGGVGLLWAQRFPERVERLVVMNAVPLLPGYRWHRWARVWRTPVLGEVAMGATTGFTIRRLAGLPAPVAELAARHFDQGTQRAVLRLYRSADPDALERAGRNLAQLSCPSLVVWGDGDPYIASNFAEVYGQRLPASEVRHLADAGHWPWIDRPDVVDDVAAFLAGRS
ncbi:MAG: alpha/beta fold hydrolase [Solirubrobacterales bacterium]|nr:alpha/beta fold hydrolase [Solirubrobacterales bacterium]